SWSSSNATPARLDHITQVALQSLCRVNVGCGLRAHPDWINLDLCPRAVGVIKHDLMDAPLPFPDDSVDCVYHSHLLEHLPPEKALPFMIECHRVLKKGGILRVAVPDLEQVARLYLTNLEHGCRGDVPARRRHAWLLLEMFDQMVRERSGGRIPEFLRQ